MRLQSYPYGKKIRIPLKQLSDLKIDKNIAIIGTGNSIYNTDVYDYDYIKNNYFTIGINLFDKFETNAHTLLDGDMWSKYAKTEHPIITAFNRLDAFWKMDILNTCTNPNVYIYDWKIIEDQGILENNTFICTLQILRILFPNRFIYLFGVDLNGVLSIEQSRAYAKMHNYNEAVCDHMFGAISERVHPILVETVVKIKDKNPRLLDNVFNCSNCSSIPEYVIPYLDYKNK